MLKYYLGILVACVIGLAWVARVDNQYKRENAALTQKLRQLESELQQAPTGTIIVRHDGSSLLVLDRNPSPSEAAESITRLRVRDEKKRKGSYLEPVEYLAKQTKQIILPPDPE
jgi:hypothetical protein